MKAGFQVEKLRRDHPIDGFSCGVAALDRFIIRYALASQQANAAQTYPGLYDGAVIGFTAWPWGRLLTQMRRNG